MKSKSITSGFCQNPRSPKCVNSRKVQISSRNPSAVFLVWYSSVYICSFLSRSARREKVVFKKNHLLVFMQTHCSPSVGWATWVKQTQMPPTSLGVTLLKRREKYMLRRSEDRRQELSRPAARDRGEDLGLELQIWRLVCICQWIYWTSPRW